MTTTTESGGRQNMFPAETRPYIDESISYQGYPLEAEKANGRWAMRFHSFIRCLYNNWSDHSWHFLNYPLYYHDS